KPEPNCSLVQVLKSLQCWMYQCCEGDVPQYHLDKENHEIEKGCFETQTDRRGEFSRLWMLDLVFNHSGRQLLPALMVALAGDCDQITAIMQTHPGLFVAATIQPSQDVGSFPSSRHHDLATADARVTQQQQVRTTLPLQQGEHEALFAELDWGELGIE